VVGNAAVEARIVSPAVLIAVAVAGIAGYTMPNQDFGNALRLWRLALTVLAGVGGVFALAMGVAALIVHLAGLESFGVPYLTPFAADPGDGGGLWRLIRRPLHREKLREGALRTRNRRNQK
jgi:hypothetical protein